MPRFKTFSEAVQQQIKENAPEIKFPMGSALNAEIGKPSLNQDYNFTNTDDIFRWGYSVWGYNNITSEYSDSKSTK